MRAVIWPSMRRMGMSFATYAVSLDKLKATCGSGDAKLLAQIIKGAKQAIADADDGESPPLAKIIADLVNGKVTYKKHGYSYAVALAVLCAHFGKPVANVDLSPMWVASHLDKLLGGDIMKIMRFLSKPVIALPKRQGLPEITTLDAAQCKALTPRFADAAARGKKEQTRALQEIGAWLEAGAAAGLVIFIW